MADLKIIPRKHGNARGKDVHEQILRAAFKVWVEQGSNALTLWRIAEECGMKAGNLAYYFSSKNDLIRDLMECITYTYEELINEIRFDTRLGPEDQLAAFVDLALNDITSRETTAIFPDLWAAATHDPFFQGCLDDIYAQSRSYLVSLVGALNPALSLAEQEVIALFMQASMEGLTVFAGFNKPGSSSIEWLARATQQSFLGFITNARPGEISGEAASGTASIGRARKSRLDLGS